MANETQKSTLSFGQLLGYGAFGMGFLTFTASWVAYMVMPFLTNIAGFSTQAAAGIYSLSNIIKVLATIAGGAIIDSINWKKGKFRTWVLVGGIMLVVFSVMFYKFNLPEGTYVIVFTILFFMNQFSYQCAWVGQRSLAIKFAKNNQDNVMLTTAAQLGTMGAGVIFGMIYVPLYTGPLGKNGTDFFPPTLLYSLVAFVGCVGLFLMAKNYDLPAESNPTAPKAQKVGILDMLKSLKGMGLVYFVAGTLGNIQSGFFSTLLFYFTTYVLKNPTIAGYAVTANSIGGFLGALSTPWVVKKTSNKWAYQWSHFISAALYLCIWLFGRTPVVFLVIRALLGAIGSWAGVTLPALANDLADYNEMKGVSSAKGFVQSLMGLTIRLALVISGAISSFGLAATGFDAATAAASGITEKTANSIMMLLGVAPAVVCVLCGLTFYLWKVNDKELNEFRMQRMGK